jgi:hypothetical protein
MEPIVPINIIPDLLKPIKEVVSQPQFEQIERLVRGILLVKGRRTLEAIRQALAEPISKGSFNHFLAGSPWSEAAVQREVLTMLESDAAVAPRASGLLFADDTLTGQHYGQQMAGLAKYRDVTQPGYVYIYSHCLVNLHYEHDLSRAECRRRGQSQPHVEYWLDYRLYRRQAELAQAGRVAAFRTKPQLLIDMLKAQDWQRLPVKTIVFDHAYLTPAVVQTVTDLQLGWVAKAGKDDYAWYKGQWRRLDQILSRLPQAQFKAIWVQTSQGRRRYWVCKRRLRLRTLYHGQRDLTVVFSKTSRDATEAVYLVSSHRWSARRIVRTYARRWTIETGHKQQKHLLGVADYQMTHLVAINRFWLLNLIAYAVLALVRFSQPPLVQELLPAVRTLGQARQVLYLLALQAFVSRILTLARVYGPLDIVRLLVKGLPADALAFLARLQPL